MYYIFRLPSTQVKALHLQQKEVMENDDKLLEEAVQKMEEHHGWDIEAKIDEILEKLNITYPHALLEKLSGGQAKRVALAKLLIEDPDFLILEDRKSVV